MRSLLPLQTIILTLLTLAFTARTASAALLEPYDKGAIDWEQGLIRVVGYGSPPPDRNGADGAPPAIWAAKADALRNALELVTQVRVNGSTTVAQLLLAGDLSVSGIEDYLNSGRFGEPRFAPGGICSITYLLPLGELSAKVAPVAGRAGRRTAALPPANAPMAPMAPLAYSGIIIDARRTGLSPALYPQILDSRGYLLYGPGLAQPAADPAQTIVAYSRSPEQAQSLPRIGNNPLFLTAAAAQAEPDGGTATDPVLGLRAARHFRAAVVQSDIPSSLAVVIVIDAP
jgi:hypothetical protein